jgi:hypothetical protein
VPPKGGIKDTLPPALKKSNPPMNTIFFENNGFQLEFDELIVLDNVNSQLVISPPLKEKPVVGVMKKKLNVKFNKEDLLPNTTYSFNFGSAIMDYNEGNILKNFNYVFSTGSYIDSLQISGTVFDAFTEEAIENVAVLMYKSLEDSMPLTSLPNYFGITDEKGNYTITNIKEGSYKLFALLDMNQNYIYDLPNEKIAFLNEKVSLDSSIMGVDMRMFLEKNEKQFITDQKIEDYGRLLYVFNKPLEKLEIILKNEIFTKDEYKFKLYEKRDTLKIWFPDYKDKFRLIVKEDSIFSDTIQMDVTPVFSIEEMPPFKITPNLSGMVDLNKTLTLQFENPITKWEPRFILLFEDSVEVEIAPYFTDSIKTSLVIPYEWKEKSKYFLLVGLGSFVDFYNQINDIYELRFGAQEKDFYGILNMNFDFGEAKTPFLFVLMDTERKVLSQKVVDKGEVISYHYLRPEEYEFRLIQDLNNNGKWDTGDYEEQLQPEPVLYYPEISKIRSNWEVDINWGVIIK